MSEGTARAALEEALDTLVTRGDTIPVVAWEHNISYDQLVGLAQQVRDEFQPDAGVECVRYGHDDALVYTRGASPD